MNKITFALAVALLAQLARPAAAADAVGALDPLTVTAPRDKIKQEMIDPAINLHLMRLLRYHADKQTGEDPLLVAGMGKLGELKTVIGYKLIARYSTLGFLLTEGLAGVKDFTLASEVERVARQSKTSKIRSAAMVALAYTKDARYLPVFQDGVRDQDPTIRFSALESMLLLGDPTVKFLIADAARGDQSIPLRIYAAASMWQLGDVYGREILLRYYQDNDWLIRAMSTYYLGEMGGSDEFQRLQRQLAFESHPSVKAELVLALLKLESRGAK